MTYDAVERTEIGRTGIQSQGVTKSFGTTQVLKGVDLEVASGSVVALLGPNGAGKTTMVRILTTLLRPDGGRAFVGGFDVVSEADQARRLLGLTSQETSVDGLLTGRENLVMVGRLSRLGSRTASRRADDLLALMDLQDAAGRPVKTYSGGMRRRLDLAATLVASPAILFLDEPTTGLDPLARQTVWDAIRGLVDQGTTVLLTTQYLAEADMLADRIVVIDDGDVIVEGTPTSLKRRVGAERADLTFAASRELTAAQSILAGLTPAVTPADTTLSFPIDDPWRLESALSGLRGAGLKPLHVTVTQPTLDDVFIAVTNSRRADTGGDVG